MKKGKILLWFISTYLYIVLIPILGILITNNVLLGQYENKYMSTYDVSVKSVINSIDGRINQIQVMNDSLTSNNDIVRFTSKLSDRSANDTLDIMNIKNILKTQRFDSELVKNVFIYSSSKNIIVDSSTVYRTPKAYFDIKGLGSYITYEKWFEYLQNQRWKCGYINIYNDKTNNDGGMCFIQTIPLNPAMSVTGSIFVELIPSGIKSPCLKLLEETNGQLYIFNSRGELLLATDEISEENLTVIKNHKEQETIKIDRKKFLGVSEVGKQTGLTYTVVFPEEVALRKMIVLKRIIIFVNLLIVSLCMGLCIYVGKKKKTMLYDVFDKLNVSEGEIEDYILNNKKTSEMSIFTAAISRLMESNESEKRAYEFLRKKEYYNKLLNNSFDDLPEPPEGITLPDAAAYAVMILHLGKEYRDYIGENISVKDFVVELVSSFTTKKVEFVDVNARDTAVIFAFSENEGIDKFFREFISNAMSEINYAYNIDVQYGVGDSVENILKISKSYSQAKAVIKYLKFYKDRCITLYKDISDYREEHFYPAEEALKIYNYTVAGYGKKAVDLLRTIYDTNFNKNKLSPKETELLLEEIEGTLRKINETACMQCNCSFEPDQKPMEFFEQAYRVIDEVSNEIKTEKNNRSDRAIKDIISYIDVNYADTELSLTKLSDAFKLHEHYISVLFKKIVGENFYAYVQKKRIEKACELLKTTNMTVREISKVVGYSDDMSFRRTFKKIKGVPPSKYV